MSWIILRQVSDCSPNSNNTAAVEPLWLADPSIMLDVDWAIVWLTGVVPATVITKAWLEDEEHYVNTRARTINFWWIGSSPKFKVIKLLFEKAVNSITFSLYKNELNKEPEVATVIPL